jgi:hypothetical protein
MRRLLIIALAALFVLPTLAFAQGQKTVWDLNADTHVDVQDLGFRFYYPQGWVLDTSKGITVGETQADIDAEIDGNPATEPKGPTISVQGIPLTALSSLGDNPALDDIVDTAVKSGNLTEAGRTEAPVMTRRSITVYGSNTNGREGMASFWKQGENVVVASLALPAGASPNDYFYTWGVTIGSIAPLDAQPLGDQVLTNDTLQFTIGYPQDWSIDPKTPGTVYEKAEDIGVPFAKSVGSIFSVTDVALTDMGLTADSTLDDVVALFEKSLTIKDNPLSEEFVFLNQPAVTVTAEPAETSPGAGHGVIFTASIIDGRAVILALVTPTMDDTATMMPTWIQMLRTGKSTAPAK